MNDLLTPAQKSRLEEFRTFASTHVEPHACDWDRSGEIPDSVFNLMARAGYLGVTLPVEYGGKDRDSVSFGLLNEALGRYSSSLAGILTVQSMVSMAILRSGSEAQKKKWIPSMASGELRAAFALTEPGTGSDLHSLSTTFTASKGGTAWTLSGEKKWISFAQTAGVFLVFGRSASGMMAALVPSDSDGLVVEPIEDLLGFRTARLGRLFFREVRVPAGNVVGKPGQALLFVAPIGLHYGRMSTACSALGLLRGCLEESAVYASRRQIGERRLADIGMAQQMIARMGADWESANLLCWDACRSDDEHSPRSLTRILTAKYFTSRAAARAASDAVQILGAAGCHESSAVARFYRDAKVMEIIEGTTQVHEEILGKHFVQDATLRRREQGQLRLSV